MNWPLIILGLVALSSVAIAENSYLVIVPKLLKVGYDNQFSVFIAAAPQPVKVTFELTLGSQQLQSTTTVNAGVTRNATMTLPTGFPTGAAELTITGSGGLTFQEKRDIIIYDNQYVVLVQTSASTYRPGDNLEFRVVVTNEDLMPIENQNVLIEIYDGNLKLVGTFPHVPVSSGITETLPFPIGTHCNIGTWLVTATVANTTSSVQVLVAEPITPSFDLKAIFQQYLLRTDKTLRGVIEMDNDNNQPIFGRGTIAIGQITEQDVQNMMKQPQGQQEPLFEQWRNWKSQSFEIAGVFEINYDLSSLFNVDVTKCVAVQVYIQVTDLVSGQERFIQHVIPIFTHDVVYDIRPLQFEAGINNEFEVIAKRPDGKPAKMENLIVTVTMLVGNAQGKVQEQSQIEIKEFYTRGRNDIGLFNVMIPENVIGVLMTIVPLSTDGQVRGYRTHAIPLSPLPRHVAKGAKLTIELLPSMPGPSSSQPNAGVVSTQISTVGRTSNFYVQLLPSQPVQKFEQLPVSYMLLTNGRIVLTGEFTLQPTKECQSMAKRAIPTEPQTPPACVFNGTLPIQITEDMLPYSTLIVYAFQPSFGYNVVESYRFSVAGLFQYPLTLNATIVPYTPATTNAQELYKSWGETFDSSEDVDLSSVSISARAQDKTRVQLSFTGTPGSVVGLNVMEYDSVMQGLSNEITKERVLQYLTNYEQIPLYGMPAQNQQPGSPSKFQPRTSPHFGDDSGDDSDSSTSVYSEKRGIPSDTDFLQTTTTTGTPSGTLGTRTVVSEAEEQQYIENERMALKVRYPIEKMGLGLTASRNTMPIEGDDVYTTPNLGRLYGDKQNPQTQSYYRRRGLRTSNQYDVFVAENDYVVATSMPIVAKYSANQQQTQGQPEQQPIKDDVEAGQQDESQGPSMQYPQYGTPVWYEKMNSKLNTISPEAYQFLHSGLSLVTDFPALFVPAEIRRANLTRLFSQFRQNSPLYDQQSFTFRDQARALLNQYLVETDLSMAPPPIVLEEQARVGYYRSIYFNTSRIESQGTGKVVLPRTKPYSTWLATGFALNPKSGLSVAQPIRLPTNQGLFILGNFPSTCQVGEHVLLTYGINNYLGKDLTNVIVRIRASNDFDLVEQSPSERIVSSNGKDYTITIPALRSLAVETRNIVLVPKRTGVVKIILEVESEFGGDYEILTACVQESGIQRGSVSVNLYDLTGEKKQYGPVVEKFTSSPAPRSVLVTVSGTGLQRLVNQETNALNSLVGVDLAIIRLWRLLRLMDYLNETSQMQTPLYDFAMGNISTAYQKLLIYNNYNGSFSFISDQGEQLSSLYLTTFALGNLISPWMPVHDNITINQTLSWILSLQQSDGSFDDQGPCFYYQFCSGPYRRQALTALVLYSLTRNNVSTYLPPYVYSQLFIGESSPIVRAQRYLESQLPVVKSCPLTTTLIQLSLLQSPLLSAQTRQLIYQNVRLLQLTVVPENGAKYYKIPGDKYTFDDQLLVNSLLISIYSNMGDFQTTMNIAQWIVEQMELHPQTSTVVYGIFGVEAWVGMECLLRRRIPSQKFSIVVDITADNGQKQQFKIDSTNMDYRQQFFVTVPVNQITYSVSGFGIAAVSFESVFIEKQQTQVPQPMPFQLTNDFQPMPWLNEIFTKTCITYTPTPRDQQIASNAFNRTVVVEVQLPSGSRINLRQVGFFLSQVPEAMYFTFSEKWNRLNLFVNVPSTVYGKPICLNWTFERLSWVTQWQPVQVRVYDYLLPETQLTRLVPIQFQPTLLGYQFVDAVHQVRPTPEQLTQMQSMFKPPSRV